MLGGRGWKNIGGEPRPSCPVVSPSPKSNRQLADWANVQNLQVVGKDARAPLTY